MPTLDDFLAGLRELRAELAECTRDLSSVRAGIAEVRHDLDGLIEQVAEQRGRVDEAAPKWSGCVGPDGLGCDVLGCRCECDFWDGGCEHPLTPEEVAKLGPCAIDGCTCSTARPCFAICTLDGCSRFDVASSELARS